MVGLTGGLASGKTTIAQLFKRCGASIIDADLLAREVVKPRRVAWKNIVHYFGPSILTTDQTIDRAALAKIVFRHPHKLSQLTQFVYPQVAREQTRIARQISRENPKAIIIYDAAMLIEAGAYTRMNHIILVKTDRATQINRACSRGGLSKAEVQRRIRWQMPFSQKLQFADTVIDGTQSIAQLRPIVKKLYSGFARSAREG